MPFRDRLSAGRYLAKALEQYRHVQPVVLALPRGGVPVAAEVASALERAARSHSRSQDRRSDAARACNGRRRRWWIAVDRAQRGRHSVGRGRGGSSSNRFAISSSPKSSAAVSSISAAANASKLPGRRRSWSMTGLPPAPQLARRCGPRECAIRNGWCWQCRWRRPKASPHCAKRPTMWSVWKTMRSLGPSVCTIRISGRCRIARLSICFDAFRPGPIGHGLTG